MRTSIFSSVAPASTEWLSRYEKVLCELWYRESGGETGRKEGVKMSNVKSDFEVFLEKIVFICMYKERYGSNEAFSCYT